MPADVEWDGGRWSTVGKNKSRMKEWGAISQDSDMDENNVQVKVMTQDQNKDQGFKVFALQYDVSWENYCCDLELYK